MAEVQTWFKEHVEEPTRKNGIRVTLRLVKVNNTIKKPGPVFLEMARAAYKAGAAYFYRINDDTELMVNWAKKYVEGKACVAVESADALCVVCYCYGMVEGSLSIVYCWALSGWILYS
jgi:hypothetical protein